MGVSKDSSLLGLASAQSSEAIATHTRVLLGLQMFRRRNTPIATPVKQSPIAAVDSKDDRTAYHTSSSLSLSSNPDARMSNGTVVANRYRLEKTIGKGSYGKVKMATDLSTGNVVAVKFIAKSSIKKPAHSVRIQREINLLTALHHPNIVRLFATLDTPHDIILVMEYVQGADLFEKIVGLTEKRYQESEGRGIFQQIAEAVEYCHHYRVIHRDLKPENVMVEASTGRCILIDFGFANMFHPHGHLETNCGSPLYAAPEIVQGVQYTGPEVDVWSLGVILYAMLTGSLPFEDEQLKGLYSKICAGDYSIPAYLSPGAKDLIRRMLCVDSNQRLTISQVLNHPWVHPLNLPPRIPPFRAQHLQHAIVEADQEILQAMISYGYPHPDETRILLASDPEDPASAVYTLLCEKREREYYSREQPLMLDLLTRPLASLMTPPATPIKLFSPTKRPSGSPIKSSNAGGSDLSSAIHGPILPETSISVKESTPLSSPLNVGTPTATSIVSQAAASVANHFKRLRGLAFNPGKSALNGSMGGAYAEYRGYPSRYPPV